MSLRDLAHNATPLNDLCTDQDCPGCGRVSSHSQEGTNTLLLFTLAPDLATLTADMADLLQRLTEWDHMQVAADGRYWCEDEIAPLLTKFQKLENSAIL